MKYACKDMSMCEYVCEDVRAKVNPCVSMSEYESVCLPEWWVRQGNTHWGGRNSME